GGASNASNSWRLIPRTYQRKFFGAKWLKQPDHTKPIADLGTIALIDKWEKSVLYKKFLGIVSVIVEWRETD
ncbi:MAG: hypothetical protein SV775_19100, partial [Thermodesulfobacteriota bacterium]|nr:hypothetical protein [Thermodesulfobacteriota bacterium]